MRRLLAISIILLGACATATVVPLADSNVHLLNGTWEGTIQMRGSWGEAYSNAKLEMKDGQGTFFVDGWGSWGTAARLKDGKVILSFAYGYREFTLKQTDSTLYLEASYETEWDGRPRTDYVRLKKK